MWSVPTKSTDFPHAGLPPHIAAGQTRGAAKSAGRNLETEAAHFQCRALATGEGIDATGMAQPASLIIGNNQHVTEAMAALVPLKDTTQRLDLYGALKKNHKKTLKWFSLSFGNVCGTATDGTQQWLVIKRKGDSEN